MNKKIRFVISIIVVIFVVVLINAKVRLNDIQPAFAQDTNKMIESNMVNGAVLSFEADSYFNSFLAEVEKGNNYELMSKLLNLTSQKLSESYNYYQIAYNVGEKVGYRIEYIQKFKGFDYDSIRRKFNHEKIFYQIVNCFKNSNILGVYKQNMDYLLMICGKINLLNNDIRNKKLNIVEIQNITILMYDNGIFGNYATQIANIILN